MGGGSPQPRVVGDRTNGARADHPRGKSKRGGGSHQCLIHSKVAGVSLYRMIGASQRPRVHESKRGGVSLHRMTGGNLLLRIRATRASGANPPNRCARRSQAPAVQ